MANRWTFVEDSLDLWAGDLAVPGTSFTTTVSGSKCFYVDRNPSGVTQNNTSTIKEFDTVDGESIRINTFRPGDNKRKTYYDIKLEYQSFTTTANLQYLFINAKKFKLYITDPGVRLGTLSLYLSIDDMTVEWIAQEGERQIYSITMKCRDILTDATGNPIKWRFEENPDRSPWSWSGNGLGVYSGMKYFLSDFSPSSAQDSFKKRTTEVETINGNIVRISPIRIAPDGSIEKVPVIKNINVKFDYQNQPFVDNILGLYNNANEFDLYSDALRNNHVGLYVIDDYTVEYMAVRATNRLYGISLVLREVEIRA